MLVDDFPAESGTEVEGFTRLDQRLRQRMGLCTRQPAEEDRHQPGSELVVGDLVARVPEHQPVELPGAQLTTVALALDQLDRAYGQGSTMGWPGMSLRGRFPPSHALTLAPTSANSPS